MNERAGVVLKNNPVNKKNRSVFFNGGQFFFSGVAIVVVEWDCFFKRDGRDAKNVVGVMALGVDCQNVFRVMGLGGDVKYIVRVMGFGRIYFFFFKVIGLGDISKI